MNQLLVQSRVTVHQRQSQANQVRDEQSSRWVLRLMEFVSLVCESEYLQPHDGWCGVGRT